jgi:hypothetical protein
MERIPDFAQTRVIPMAFGGGKLMVVCTSMKTMGMKKGCHQRVVKIKESTRTKAKT